jgi:N-acetyl sugar amidotransferase
MSRVTESLKSSEDIRRPYRVCTRCVMDTTDPDIQFDENGICSHCHNYERVIQTCVFQGAEGELKLTKIIESVKKNGKGKKYDCVIGLSGGVDSSFVAYRVKQYGLRPLAVHLDNGWDSELAVKNIENICRRLEIDLHTIVLDWEDFRELQIAFLKASTPDSEIPSDHAIVSSMYYTAKEYGVPIIAGYNYRTESHFPAAWSQGHYDWRYIRNVNRKFGSGSLKTFPHLNWIQGQIFVRQLINILNYIDYNKTEAMHVLEKELGWRYYGSKHHESIYTRFYQGYILPVKFLYDKRRAHLSSLICSGELSREEALNQLNESTYSTQLQEDDKSYIIKKFGMSEAEFEEIMNLPVKSFCDYSSYASLQQLWFSPMVRWLYRKYLKKHL